MFSELAPLSAAMVKIWLDLDTITTWFRFCLRFLSSYKGLLTVIKNYHRRCSSAQLYAGF